MKLIYLYPKEAYQIYDFDNWTRIKKLFIDTNHLKYILEYPTEDINVAKELVYLVNITNSFMISPNNYKFILSDNSELLCVVFEDVNSEV